MHTSGATPSVLEDGYQEFVRALFKLSEAYMYEARLDDALCLLNADAVRRIEGKVAPSDRARIQVQRARILKHKCGLRRRGYDAVLEILAETEETATALDDKGLLADVVDLAGEAHYEKEWGFSTLETPLRYFQRGLALRQEIGDGEGITASLLHIGWVYQHRTDASEADLQKAFEHFREAYRLAGEGGYPLIRAEAARHMADIHRRRGELDQALSGHKEFVAISQEVGFKLFVPRGYVMVGISHLMRGELDQALAACEKARALALEVGYDAALAEAAYGIGAVKEAQGDADAALPYYQGALAAAQSSNFDFVAQLARQKLESLAGE